MGVTKFKLVPDNEPEIESHSSEPIVEIDSGEGAIERFVAKSKQFRNYPPAQYFYHAYGKFRYNNWTVKEVKFLLAWARIHALEVRAWTNDESGINLIVLKDKDTSEDSGYALYVKIKELGITYDSYGLASWYEYDKWGVPLSIDEDIVVEPLRGAQGVKVGKGNNWVIID